MTVHPFYICCFFSPCLAFTALAAASPDRSCCRTGCVCCLQVFDFWPQSLSGFARKQRAGLGLLVGRWGTPLPRKVCGVQHAGCYRGRLFLGSMLFCCWNGGGWVLGHAAALQGGLY
jgi:hypothetical protein